LSDNDPAAQGSIDMTYGIFYAGAWATTLDTDPYGFTQGPAEVDLYAGIKPVWGPVTFDFGSVLYLYPGESNDNYTYVELKAGASMEILKGLTAGGIFWYTPEQSNYYDGYAVEGTLAYALPQMGIFAPSVSGLIGYAENSEGADYDPAYSEYDYVYWNAGVTLGVEKFSMDFRYWDTNISGDGNFYAPEYLADERFVFTAKVTLP
jgi:uncharacterized protein (TIGR02001 family)